MEVSSGRSAIMKDGARVSTDSVLAGCLVESSETRCSLVWITAVAVREKDAATLKCKNYLFSILTGSIRSSLH